MGTLRKKKSNLYNAQADFERMFKNGDFQFDEDFDIIEELHGKNLMFYGIRHIDYNELSDPECCLHIEGRTTKGLEQIEKILPVSYIRTKTLNKRRTTII